MSSVADAVLAILLFLAFVFLVVILPFVGYQQVRRRGYQPPTVAAILICGCAIGIAGTVAIGPANTTNASLFLLKFFWVPLLFSTAAIALMILTLPRRKARIFGERRVHFPFRAAGQSLIVLGVLLVVLVGLVCLSGGSEWSTFGKAVSLALMLTPAGLYLIRRAKTLRTPPLEQVLRDDPRPPVLYLRAFNQESQFFVVGKKAEFGRWAKSFHAAVAKNSDDIGITVEEYLADEITRSIGPFIALGSPEDYIAPLGALRMYAKDDEWKTQFDKLARKASCMIVEVSKSDNLRWELEHLRHEGMHQGLFILTRPAKTGSKFAWAFWGLIWKLKGLRTIAWEEFSAAMAKMAYEISFDDPGGGVVIAFDSTGNASIIATNARWPKDFVEPIRDELARRQPAGPAVAHA